MKKYLDSNLDRTIRTAFIEDMTCAHLRQIKLNYGSLRGLNKLNLEFKYPITAVAGKNGVGKTTVLAMAACAYHNKPEGFKLRGRERNYYTFSDFFVQSSSETPPQGISIDYGIAFNNWRANETFPQKIGVAFQERWKSAGGKWNNYAQRVDRNVVFLGVGRVVPHAERSQSRSYSKAFKKNSSSQWDDKIKTIAGEILGKQYTAFENLHHSKYTLPQVSTEKSTYSGFNMGAGENAIFEIFSAIYNCGKGALIIIDEIELGLHAAAQSRLIDKLKEACKEMKTQVIFTTHSKEIFDKIPLDGRIFIESVNGSTKTTAEISSVYAFSKLSEKNHAEIEILSEDELAKSILTAALPSETRKRLTITSIGSAGALSRQLSSQYLKNKNAALLAVFDGDQRDKERDNRSCALKASELSNDSQKDAFNNWFNEKILYLPGSVSPEKWLINACLENLEYLSKSIKHDDTYELGEILHAALNKPKHEEPAFIAEKIGLPVEICTQNLITAAIQIKNDELEALINKIKSHLA